jgi:hypothetical protein
LESRVDFNFEINFEMYLVCLLSSETKFSIKPTFENAFQALQWLKYICSSLVRGLHEPLEYVSVMECNNLIVTSKNETTNSPIHKFKVLQNVI